MLESLAQMLSYFNNAAIAWLRCERLFIIQTIRERFLWEDSTHRGVFVMHQPFDVTADFTHL